MDQEFAIKCRSWWTPERLQKITGGKNLLLTPPRAPELLRVMGLLNQDGSMSSDNVSKFLQINHMLQLMLPSLEDLRQRFKVVRVFDAGCGNSFLTLLVAWLFRSHWQKECEIIGVDLNTKVIQQSLQRAKTLGYDEFLKFAVAPIADTTWNEVYRSGFQTPESEEIPRPHLVTALHACDVATDYALSAAIHRKADVIAVAPCCQAELAQKWKGLPASDHPFHPIFATPNLRREIAAQCTDTFRLLLCRAHGYEVTATEFVPASHTPKNRLMLCVRRGNYLRRAADEYERLKEALGGCAIKLETLLAPPSSGSDQDQPAADS